MYKIISDTACDILKDFAEENDITLVPFYVSFDYKTYKKEQFEVDHTEFYRKMIEEKAFPKSSLPSVQDYIDTYMPYVKQNIPIISICISSLFSGSYNSACTARLQILEDYPDAKIAVIDSLQNASSEGLFVYEALRMRKDNIPYEKAIEVLEKMKPLGRIFFTIDSLEYLKKGGRIGKLTALIGGKLSIRPLIVMKNGELAIGGVARTRNKAKANLIQICQKHFADNNLSIDDYDINVEVGHGFDECNEYRAVVEDALKTKCVESREPFPTRIGVCTACHTGPGAIGMGVMPKYETLL